ncbi:MAG: zinc ribbon domain-containing protein [Armatimonadota bacterium]
MPIYEFGCRPCGNRFEELFFGGDDVAAVRCPECGSRQVERVASAFFAKTSSSNDGGSRSLGGSGCGTCAATSCAGCRR